MKPHHVRAPRSRRSFLSFAAGVAAAFAMAPAVLAAQPQAENTQMDQDGESTGKKVLFLGGTGFLGPHTVRELVERGHEVTLFNRGSRTDQLFPDLEFIEGNRIPSEEPGLTNLEAEVKKGRRWDTVIDTASVHRWTEDTAALLKDAADQYIYISSISVYDSEGKPGADESASVHTMPDDVADSITRLPYDMQYYGAVKARSEDAARKHFPDGALIIRPGLIVGPGDYTGRFTYWPRRIAEGGEVLAPGSGEDMVQIIDVRDLGDWIVRCIEHGTTGTFNAVTDPIPMASMLEDVKKGVGSDAELVWVPAQFLAEQGVQAWVEMPMWVPNEGDYAGFGQRSNQAAKAAGLTFRPIPQIASDTLDWWKSLPEDRRNRPTGFGLDPAKEKTVLEAWEAQRDSAG